MKKILVVCAHPDDETLGLGGTIAKHSQNGDQVFVVIFADGESARSNSKKNIVMRKNQAKITERKIDLSDFFSPPFLFFSEMPPI